MKLSAAKRWKRKQQKFHLRRSKSVIRKSSKKQDLSGKYVILLSEHRSKYAVVLKFKTRTLCKVKAAVAINNKIIKQISRKFIISPNKPKYKKILSKIEVIVTKRFKEQYERLHSPPEPFTAVVKQPSPVGNKSPNVPVVKKPSPVVIKQPSPAKEPPPAVVKTLPDRRKSITIKIFSCSTCNHKFTSKKLFEEHGRTHMQQESSDEGELMIDDDVLLVIDDEVSDIMPPPNVIVNLKADPDEAKAEEFCCMMQNCQKKFDTEEMLVAHIGLHHKDDKPFKCNKCEDSFSRESGLIAHQRMRHPVEIIPPIPQEPPKRGRRKSVFVPSTINGTANETLKINGSTMNSAGIVFKPYNSIRIKKFICRICSAIFTQRDFLDRHISVHHVLKIYHCFKCKNSFTMIKLLEHLKMFHMDSVNDPRYIKTISDVECVAYHRCAFCRYSSNIRPAVNAHMKDEHYDEFEKSDTSEEDHASSPDSLENILTPESSKILSKKEELAKEAVEKKARRGANDPSFKNRCVRCQRRFAKPETLRKHTCRRLFKLTAQNPSNPSRIPQATNKDEAMTPQPRIVPKPPMLNGFFNCMLCPRVFTDRALFNVHVSTGHLSSQNQPKSSTNGFYKDIH